VRVPSAALEVKPLHKTAKGRVFQILVYTISARHNLFFLQNTCTSKQKLVNETNPAPSPQPPASLPWHSLRHSGAEGQSESPRRHCPGRGPSICTLLKVRQNPCTKALCIPLAFLRPTTSCVSERVCVSQGACC